MIIEEKDLKIFKNEKFGDLIETIVKICNSKDSIFSKKIVIDLEVLESYV